MKKTIKFIVVILVALLAVYLGVRIFQRIERQKNIETAVSHFQEFSGYELQNNKEICTDTTLPDMPILLLFVHPECDFCKEEIMQLIALRKRLEKIVVVLITHAEKDQARDFFNQYDFSRFTHLFFFVDDHLDASILYGTPPIPSVFLYSVERKLLFKHNSAVKMETVLNYLP